MSTAEGTRVPPTTYDDLPPAAQAAHDAHEQVAPITNMTRTLLHSVPAFEALMTWYPLRDAVRPFLMESGTLITAKEAVRLGAYDYLSKPVGPGEVMTATQGALRRKQFALRGQPAR